MLSEREKHLVEALEAVVNERYSELDMMSCKYPRGSIESEAWHDGVQQAWKLWDMSKQPARDALMTIRSAERTQPSPVEGRQEQFIKDSLAWLAEHTEGEARAHVEVISCRLGYGHAADLKPPISPQDVSQPSEPADAMSSEQYLATVGFADSRAHSSVAIAQLMDAYASHLTPFIKAAARAEFDQQLQQKLREREKEIAERMVRFIMKGSGVDAPDKPNHC